MNPIEIVAVFGVGAFIILATMAFVGYLVTSAARWLGENFAACVTRILGLLFFFVAAGLICGILSWFAANI